MPPIDPSSGSTRATPVALIALAALLLVARVGVGIWQEESPDAKPELVSWVTPEDAAAEARAGGRPLLIAFTDPANPASRKLAHQVFTDPKLAEQITKSFVPVRVEGPAAADSPAARALRERYPVSELPALVVSTSDGARSLQQSGYHDARATAEFLARSRFALTGVPMGGSRTRGFQFHFGTGNGPPGQADTSAAPEEH